MPRGRSLVAVVRDMVREQVQDAVQGLLGAVGGPKRKAKNGRRRRRKRRGPGRPPGAETRMRRGGGGTPVAFVFPFSAPGAPSGAGGASRTASLPPGRAGPPPSVLGRRR